MRSMNIVWTSVTAAALAVASIVAGVLEGHLTVALGLSAVVAAALSFRER